jgi:hypothetical protein
VKLENVRNCLVDATTVFGDHEGVFSSIQLALMSGRLSLAVLLEVPIQWRTPSCTRLPSS